jgi:hypothetical protein
MSMSVKHHRSRLGLLFATAAAVLMTAAGGVLFTLISAEGSPSESILFREEFNTLDRWKPLKFKKVRNLSDYTLDLQANKECYLRAHSSGSASALVWQGEYDVYEYPKVRWRWKVSNIYTRGNAFEKSGDDYPMRIYVMFKYDPEDPNVKRKFKYGLGKFLYGEYPPYKSLTYIWANRDPGRQYFPNPYTGDAMMIPLRSGPALAGHWLTEEVNVLEDYRTAFGTDPPRMAGLAIMNDSDDTGESSESWIDYIEIFRSTEDLTGNGEKEKGKAP